MHSRNLLISLWAFAVFFLSANTFNVVMDTYVVISASWHQRLLDSNYEYALSVFFLFLISLWHGIATSAFGKKGILSWAYLYKSLAMPLLIAFGLLSLIPLEYGYDKASSATSWIWVGLWFFFASDPSGKIGYLIVNTEWFKSKVLKDDSNTRNFFFKEAKGGFGVVVFSMTVLIPIIAGFFGG